MCAACHARQMAIIGITLLTTERQFWHCRDHTSELESASRGQFLIIKISCFLWRAVRPTKGVLCYGCLWAETVAPCARLTSAARLRIFVRHSRRPWPLAQQSRQ